MARARSGSRVQRRARRLLSGLGLLVILAMLAIVGLLLGLRSEAFWKRYIFPRYFGPYWFTVLKWESFTPTVFPPGLAFTNIELTEPNSSRPVFSAETMIVQSRWDADRQSVTIPRLQLRGVTYHYMMDNPDRPLESNLDRAVRRLFDGRPPRINTGPREGTSGLPRIELGSVEIEDVVVRMTDLRNPPRPIVFSYRIPGNVRLTGASGWERVGRIDESVAVNAVGSVALRVGDVLVAGSADARFEIANLAGWPGGTVMASRVSVLSNGAGNSTLTATAVSPLARASVRPSAIPYRNLDLRIQRGDDALPIIRLDGVAYDPLRGESSGVLEVHGSGGDLAAMLLEFVEEGAREELRSLIAELPIGELFAPNSRAFFSGESRFTTTGLGQFAIVDDEERLPAALSVESTGELGSVVLADVFEFLGGVETGPLGDILLDRPVDVQGQWSLAADWARGSGEARVLAAIVPPSGEPQDFRAQLRLHQGTDANEPVRFQLKRRATADDTLPSEPAGSERPSIYPEFESWLAAVNSQLAASTGRLESHGVGDLLLDVQFQAQRPELVDALLGPIFRGYETAESVAVQFSLARRNGEEPLRWEGNFDLQRIALEGLTSLTSLDGMLVLDQKGPLVRASAFEGHLRKIFPGDDAETSFTLSMKPSVPGGAPPVNLLDLRSGEGRFEVAFDELNREIIEVLLRLQTFGLSDQLARPFYQQILDFLGFRPDDPTARSEAEILLSGRVGRIFEFASDLTVRNLPATNFFFLGDDTRIDTERFDAQLRQTLILDRQRGLLTPSRFRLSLLTPTTGTPFAELMLEAEDDCRFAYNALMSFAGEELGGLAPPDRAGSPFVQGRALLAGFFQRVEKLRAAMAEGRARLTFAVPHLSLSEFQRALQAAGLPVEAGDLRLSLSATLHEDPNGTADTALGGFRLDGLRLAGSDEALPPLEGRLDLERDGDRLRVRELATTLDLGGGIPPTALRFVGDLATTSLETQWDLRLERVSTAALDLLRRFQLAGLSETSTLLGHLPVATLGELNDRIGVVDLSLSGRPLEGGDGILVIARQSGRDLAVLPMLIKPLSFELMQSLAVFDDGALTLLALDGDVREGAERLATIRLDQPVRLLAGRSVESATTPTLTFEFRKSLDGRVPTPGEALPFFEVPIVAGRFEGQLIASIPPDAFLRPDRDRVVVSDFHLAMDGLALQGHDRRFDGTVRGRWLQSLNRLELAPLEASMRVGGESAGRVRIDMEYDAAAGRIQTDLQARQLRANLLEALPGELGLWAGGNQVSLDIDAGFDGIPALGTGDFELGFRGRQLSLPALPLADGSSFQHPPLDLDVTMSTRLDRSSSTIQVQKFNAVVRRHAPLSVEDIEDEPELVPALVVAGLVAPFGYRYDTLSISPDSLEGSGIRGWIGPLDVDRYRPIVQHYLGLPLRGGEIGGELEIVTAGTGGTRRTRMAADLNLTGGAWEYLDGVTLPVEARLGASTTRRREVLRLDSLGLTVRYPTLNDVDEVSMQGYLEFQRGLARRPFVEAAVASSRLKLDRLLEFFEDLKRRAAVAEGAREGIAQATDSAPLGDGEEPAIDLLRLLREADGRLLLSFNNLRFRQVSIPRLTMRALLEQGRIQLANGNGVLNGGTIEVQGDVDLSDDDPSPWRLRIAGRDVEILPVVNSFVAPQWQDFVRGRLGGMVELSGEGFLTDSLRNARGSGTAALRGGRVANDRFQELFGETVVEIDARALIRGNRLVFELGTPWNPSREMLARGIVRELIPTEPNGAPWISLFARFDRTTTVGPRGRTMENNEGEEVPFRQSLLAVLVELNGALSPAKLPRARLRAVEY